MADKLEMLLEAERRGILPPDRVEMLQEARRRGLVPGGEESPPERSTTDGLKRAAGLTARYAVEGPTQLLGMMGPDAMTLAAGKMLKAAGADYEPRTWSQSVSNMLDGYLPKPEGSGEKFSAEVSRGLAGAGPISWAAQKAASAAKAVPGAVKAIAQSPTWEMLAQGLGGGSSQIAREAGAPEPVALAAGVISPMAAQGAVGAVKQGARAVNELRRPLTQGGAEQIAADTLGRLTQNKGRAISNLDDYLARVKGGEPVGVPGSRPTAGAVAADYGLVGGEQLIARGDANPLFANRRAENNAARLADLERLKATTANLEAMAAKREELTAPLRDRAFAETKGPVDFDRVRDAINRLRKTPEGGRNETSRSLALLDEWIVAKQAEGRVSPQDAYELHKDINLLIKGKVNDDKGVVRLAGGMATEVKNTLASEIERVAPGFRKYLNTYSRLSRPIERLEVLTEKLGDQGLTKVTNGLPQVVDAGSQYTLSQDKMRRAVDAIKGETRPAARQSDVLERVLGDLNAETFASRGGKLPGSDTYQNIASANFVNRMLGDSIAQSGAGRALTSTLGLPMRPLERRINDMIVEAYLDPEKMRKLLAKARTERGAPTLAGLLNTAGATSSAGLLGSLLP